MTDNDEAYEQARADQPADMQAQFDAEPVPAGFDAELDVDPDKVEHLTFSSATPQSKAAILAGRVPPSPVVSVAAVATGTTRRPCRVSESPDGAARHRLSSGSSADTSPTDRGDPDVQSPPPRRGNRCAGASTARSRPETASGPCQPHHEHAPVPLQSGGGRYRRPRETRPRRRGRPSRSARCDLPRDPRARRQRRPRASRDARQLARSANAAPRLP